jgi:hypothetical protein
MATVTAIAGVASAGANILGGIFGGNAQKKAQAAEEQRLQQAQQFQQQVYGTTQANMAPWITGGTGAVQGLETFLGLPGGGGPAGSGALASFNQFAKTPYYTFPLSQATDTMDRAAAAKGMSLSGGQLADLGKYASGYASDSFMKYISALTGLAGMGQTGVTTLANTGLGVGTQLGNTAANLAQAAQGGILGQQAGQNQALSGAGQLLRALGGAGGNDTSSSYGGSGGGLFSNQTIGDYSIPGTSTFGPYGSLFGSAAPGTGGGFNNASDLLAAGGGVTVPPIPPE